MNGLTCDLASYCALDAQTGMLAENTRLTAEVERLTQQLDAIRRGNEAVSTCGGAPASLPTPAPEGTDGR